MVVWKLDRLARNLRDGVNVLADRCERGIRVVSITQQLDLSGAVGRIVAALLLSVAEMARENINERIRAGVAAAKKRGVKFGRPAWKTRPYRTIDPAEVRRLRKKGLGMTEIARQLGISRQACYKAVAELRLLSARLPQEEPPVPPAAPSGQQPWRQDSRRCPIEHFSIGAGRNVWYDSLSGKWAVGVSPHRQGLATLPK